MTKESIIPDEKLNQFMEHGVLAMIGILLLFGGILTFITEILGRNVSLAIALAGFVIHVRNFMAAQKLLPPKKEKTR